MPRRFLIVGDHEPVRAAMKRSLEYHGWDMGFSNRDKSSLLVGVVIVCGLVFLNELDSMSGLFSGVIFGVLFVWGLLCSFGVPKWTRMPHGHVYERSSLALPARPAV